jgi:hypothetical protein
MACLHLADVNGHRVAIGGGTRLQAGFRVIPSRFQIFSGPGARKVAPVM